MVQPDLPPMANAERWLRAIDDPVVELLVATYLNGPDVDTSASVEGAAQSAALGAAFRSQRADGSWGDGDRPRQRVLSTLWMAKTLAELGCGSTGAWNRAAEFLSENAHTDDGVFAIDGRRDGVLSCYVGIAATTYLLGGRPELAEPQISWIRDHQQVQRAGRDLRRTAARHWSDHLAVRYGGCMSSTTCLVGLAKTGTALRCWLTSRCDTEVEGLFAAIQERFLERQLFRRGDGSVIPLGVAPKHAQRWLDPTYPLDWRPDLIEVLDLVASPTSDSRVQPALDGLAASQLEDGSWPLRRTFRPVGLPLLERRSRTRGSPVVTLRILCALRKFR